MLGWNTVQRSLPSRYFFLFQREDEGKGFGYIQGLHCQSGSVSDATLPWLVQGFPLQRYVVMIVKYPHRLDKHGRSLESSN